ncbi:MAG TPA: class I SAM-dependent methyltransferase [Nakamurella sp.]|nr:class I SAM-dependent methyltransferase [Nakamurella sp.]
MTSTMPEQAPTVTIQEQVPKLLGQVAGYVGHRTIAVGLRSGLIAELATSEAGCTAEELAERLRLDPFYVAVWCRAALATGICQRAADDTGDPADPAGLSGVFRLAPHVGTLLLDVGHPSYLGGVFLVLEQPEVFDRFERSLASGQRMWWSDCSPEWISGVAGTGTPFYTRLIPAGLDRIPGLAERLRAGCRILDSACGSGVGLVRLAQTYPACHVIGVDGDEQSLEQAGRRIADAGVTDRCTLLRMPLEELAVDEPVTMVLNNISMHECRDIERVTEQVVGTLEPGGWFVISDFPFPDTVEALQSVPGRVMAGIQIFEAQIDDQLLPRSAYPDLLRRHGFTDVDQFDLSPVHAVTHGRRAG